MSLLLHNTPLFIATPLACANLSILCPRPTLSGRQFERKHFFLSLFAKVHFCLSVCQNHPSGGQGMDKFAHAKGVAWAEKSGLWQKRKMIFLENRILLPY
jgi:hypothetical protein